MVANGPQHSRKETANGRTETANGRNCPQTGWPQTNRKWQQMGRKETANGPQEAVKEKQDKSCKWPQTAKRREQAKKWQQPGRKEAANNRTEPQIGRTWLQTGCKHRVSQFRAPSQGTGDALTELGAATLRNDSLGVSQ